MNILFNKSVDNEKKQSYEDLEILKNLQHIKKDLHSMYNQFEFITDPILIDSCIYHINAAQNKYTYYIRLCKDRNISF